jgi:uncharacterized protein (TIGR03067 family)
VGSTTKDGLVRLAIVLAMGAALAVGLWYFNFRTRDDVARFQGEWQVAVPVDTRDKQPVAKVKPVTIRVTGNRWAFVAGGKETQRYTLTLRPDANPKEIDLLQLDGDKPTKNILRGIYTIEGDRAKVLLNSGTEERPTKLDDPDGPPGLLLERVQ